ncbi:hypothetical protein EDC19_2768 [Natranaerovirga hydrolytica]|uniref:Uncharacterized protein n=1 Tax=Natranaerovirga hydrolytica TaxID=680378 RepID=A0A4R1MAE6_9FIRM|nr:hypothetical protein [Natranaerovirga hydrolytica]TCK87924.1 hypothetical protein EDC19_2768 [Natranaerovirga hydrolytica]
MVENSLWKSLAFIILVLMLFITPLYFTFMRQDTITQQVVTVETEKFTDSVRDLGYITPDAYSVFLDAIHATGLGYRVNIVHYKKQFFPNESGDGFITENQRYSNSSILEILFPDNDLPNHSRDRYYNLSTGDYILVEVANEGKTKATVFKDMLIFRDTDYPMIYVRAGGMVYGEN